MWWCSRGSGCVQPGHARVSGRSDGCSCRCSVWLRPAVRASGRLSRPKGAVRCHSRRRRIYLNVDEDIGRRGRAAPSRALALLEPRLSQPASRPRCRADVGPLVRDRACAFAAQVIGPSRATPHHLGLLHRVRLKIEVLDLLRASGEDERRAPPWCAPAGIEPPARMIATALFLC